MPKITPARWTQIWGQEPIGLALARLCELPGAEAPRSFDEWRASATVPGEHLVVLDHAYGAGQSGTAQEWLEFLKRLETQWMEPLLHALRQVELGSVTIWSDSGPTYTLLAKNAGRWWRRRRRLEAYR